MTATRRSVPLTLGLALALATPVALASGYNAFLLPTLGGGITQVSGLNNAGQVVGYSETGNSNEFHATVWNNLVATDLGTLGGTNSFATAINARGQIVGSSESAGSTQRQATLWNNGAPAVNLGSLDGGDSYAYAINNAGQVAGASTVSWGALHAAVWYNGTLTDLTPNANGVSHAWDINAAGTVVGDSESYAVRWDGPTPYVLGTLGGSSASAHAVNNAGRIVGESARLSTLTRAVRWHGDTLTDLGSLHGTDSRAYGINDSGDVVGASQAPGTATTRATLWRQGSLIDLNQYLDVVSASAGWVLTEAYDINDNGLIIAEAMNLITSGRRGYVLSPAPEPATLLMLAAGLGWTGLVLTRRRSH